MHGLHTIAWRSLWARPLRTALTTLGVSLGVAVVFAGLTTNAGIEASIGRAVAAQVGRADLRVTAVAETGLSLQTVAMIAATPGVDAAAPAFERRTYLGSGQVDIVGELAQPVTVVGIDPARESLLHDLELTDGALPGGPNEPVAVVSASLARQDGYSVGSEMTVLGSARQITYRVVGLLADDGPWSAEGGRAVLVPLLTIRELFDDVSITRVDVDLAPGVDPTVVTALLRGSLDREPFLLATPRDLEASLRASTSDVLATTALIAAVTLFVGAFLIFNTLSMTVGERIRELALLRAAGATRGQLSRFILVHAAVLGCFGALLGIGLGMLLAVGIAGELGALMPVPQANVAFLVEHAAAALAVGIGVTLAGAMEPAWRAGRVSAVEALKARTDRPEARRARLRWLAAVFGAVGLIGLLLWPRGSAEDAVGRAIAVYVALLAIALLMPVVLPPLARLSGVPFGLLAQFEERIARASVLRDRSRAALTAGALSIGLAMIVALGGVAQHARAAASAWIADVVPGDLILTSVRPIEADEGVTEALAGLPPVASVSPIARFDLAIGGRRADAVAMVGADLASDGRLRLMAGDRAALAALDDGGAVIVPAGLAAREGLAMGRVLDAVAADGTVRELRVVGIAERTLPGRGGESLLVGWDEGARLGARGADAFAIRLESGTDEPARAGLAEEARALALEPVALDRIEGAIGSALERVFGLFDALALVAVLVASLGIVNTLTMNVVERVREIGVLRAAGMTRRQVWRSVVVEAGITGTVGAVVGVLGGVLVGGLMIALAGGPFEGSGGLPWAAMAVAFVLGVGLAMLAAAYPARLASRISIARAVGYE